MQSCVNKEIPEIIWNENNNDFEVGMKASLPRGYQTNKKCPICGSNNIQGAIIHRHGQPVIPSADDVDPNIVCFQCGYWDDSI